MTAGVDPGRVCCFQKQNNAIIFIIINHAKRVSELPQRHYLQHEIPSSVFSGDVFSTFFVTVCCQRRGTNQLAHDTVWNEMLESIRTREERGVWVCKLFVAMPDHVHVLMRFEGEVRMALAIRGWKRWMSKQCGILWQRGFFDHRLRSQESAVEKRKYILDNPVRAGLVEHPRDWKYVWDKSPDFLNDEHLR